MRFLVVLMTCWSLVPAPQGAPAAGRSGQWWLALDAEQQSAFVAGYASDYTWKRRGPVKFSESADVYRAAVDARLKSKPQDAPKAVADLIEEEAARTSTGAAWRGVFAGHYWSELGSTGRLGFVQGFLECQRRDAASAAKFSKPDVWYVEHISTWYGMTTDDPLGSDEGLLGTSAIDVIMKLEDTAPVVAQVYVRVWPRRGNDLGGRCSFQPKAIPDPPSSQSEPIGSQES